MIREEQGKRENNYVGMCRSMASKGCNQLRYLSEPMSLRPFRAAEASPLRG